MSLHPLLAVIPARGGSKGLPGKNVRPLAGLPLIAHSIRCAALCPEIDRCIVSTDCEKIAESARAYGGQVPFMRPQRLAHDDVPMIPVLQHALLEMERIDNCRFESLLLLDPTSPGRVPSDIAQAIELLESDPICVGVVGASEPEFNPRWACVEERDGYLALAFANGREYGCRQEVPAVYRVNATLYLWKRDFLLSASTDPLTSNAKHRMLITPESRSIHIDTLADFRLAELLLSNGLIQLPWLKR